MRSLNCCDMVINLRHLGEAGIGFGNAFYNPLVTGTCYKQGLERLGLLCKLIGKGPTF